MKKIQLGSSTLQVTTIGLGAINFGTKVDKKDAFSILDAYVSMGGNFIDTANNYAIWNGGKGGESERVIGDWLQARNNRSSIILATKIGAMPKDSLNSNFSNMQGLRKETIVNAVEQSLRNLKTTYIDVLYLHVDDFSTPQLAVMRSLHQLVSSGKVKTIGCSNFFAWRIESARQLCKIHHLTFFDVVQQRYSYLAPSMDADFFPQVALNKDLDAYIHHYQDLTLVAYSPLLSGQYTSLDNILNKHYDTFTNKERLHELSLEKDAVKTVLQHITEAYKGSVALITTSKVEHIEQIMNYYK